MSLRRSFPAALNRRDLFALLVLLVVVLLFFWKLAFTNLIIARGDIFYYFYPYRDYAAQAVREGRIALWNPYLFMGAPFMANSQAGFFYPLNLLMSWLETTRAISWTIVLHIFIAASGVYVFGRSRLGLSIGAAWLGAVLFGLGGYLGTQVEHINQLQGLAWLGWIFFAYDGALVREVGASGWAFTLGALKWLPLSLLIALQVLAGHTQSVFITLIGLAVYAAWPALEMLKQRSWSACLSQLVRRLIPLILAAVVAVGLSALQLLPTLELTRQSTRSGGLPVNLAVSFSLDPRLLGRALLPDYEGALPAGGEFTAFFAVTALLLMIAGISTMRRATPNVRAIAVVALIGTLFALGGYEPLYYLLLKLPGFDLFRAPARWIVLFVFAGSLLAGVGFDTVLRREVGWKSLLAAAAFVIFLIGLTFLSAGLAPAGASGPLGRPEAQTLLLWLGAGILTLIAIRMLARRPSLLAACLLMLVTLELFLATRPLTYNSRATAPDALLSLRPPVTYLMAAGQGATPPDRFLSISDIRFDPGDKTELQSIFGDQLSTDAFYDLIVATKAKEIVAPNLPLVYHLPAVDGYDGGVLPLQNYVEFQRLFLDPTLIQADGRLREQLKSVPAARWLDLMNARYIITDKVGDQWYDGVLYDLQFNTRIAAGQTVTAEQLPPFKADALGLVYSQSSGDWTLAEVKVSFADGSQITRRLVDKPLDVKDGRTAQRLTWDQPKLVKSIRLSGVGGFTLHGAALIDSTSGTFQPFVIAPSGQFQLAHSGDVKIYENTTVLPRAFVAYDARVAATDDAAVQMMQAAEFDPAKTVVLNGEGENVKPSEGDQNLSTSPALQPTIVSYSPEDVVIDVNASQEGYLALTDAYYPGWIATVDGLPSAIDRADILFRAVKVPAGQHRVELRYQPQSFTIGLLISFGTLLVISGGWIVKRWRTKRRVL